MLPYASIESVPSDGGLLDELVSKVVVLKLNGGAGESMGCVNSPKSAIEVRLLTACNRTTMTLQLQSSSCDSRVCPFVSYPPSVATRPDSHLTHDACRTHAHVPPRQVRSGLTFLDFTVRQVEFLNTKHGADVPLVLMNSFRTHAETQRVLQK